MRMHPVFNYAKNKSMIAGSEMEGVERAIHKALLSGKTLYI